MCRCEPAPCRVEGRHRRPQQCSTTGQPEYFTEAAHKLISFLSCSDLSSAAISASPGYLLSLSRIFFILRADSTPIYVGDDLFQRGTTVVLGSGEALSHTRF